MSYCTIYCNYLFTFVFLSSLESEIGPSLDPRNKAWIWAEAWIFYLELCQEVLTFLPLDGDLTIIPGGQICLWMTSPTTNVFLLWDWAFGLCFCSPWVPFALSTPLPGPGLIGMAKFILTMDSLRCPNKNSPHTCICTCQGLPVAMKPTS